MPIDREILNDIFGFVAGIVGMGCFTGMVITWLKFRSRKLGSGIGPELISRLNELSERVARLDTGVDAIAVEIERISEAQRFTTKLFAERASAPVLNELPRVGATKTPH